MSQADWSGGYVADTPYVTGWHAAQAPAHLALVCALNDTAWPPADRERLTVLELGCGRGYTALALAAANPGWRVTGLDYHPAHIAEAREFAAEAGLANAEFLEADLAALDDAAAARLLPEADVVTLHGLWSWVADPVRAGILAVLRARLAPGGVAMVSYNALPGWAAGLAVQRLLRAAAEAQPGAPSEHRVGAALETLGALEAAGAGHLRGNPLVDWLLRKGRGANPAYVAHEYLTEHWRPCFSADVIRAMAAAKLDFVGAGGLVENFPALTLTPDQRAAAARLPPGPDRELAVDLCLPRSFRLDVFARGRRAADGAAALRALRLCLLAAPGTLPVRVETPLGEAALPPAVADPVLAALAEGPRGVGELLALPGVSGATPGELVAVLVGGGLAAPLWRDPPGDVAAAWRFNRAAARRHGAEALTGGASLGLAVPALGGALACGTTELMAAALLRAAAEAGQEPPDAPALARRMLRADTPPEAVAANEATIARLLREKGPAWRMLGLF